MKMAPGKWNGINSAPDQLAPGPDESISSRWALPIRPTLIIGAIRPVPEMGEKEIHLWIFFPSKVFLFPPLLPSLVVLFLFFSFVWQCYCMHIKGGIYIVLAFVWGIHAFTKHLQWVEIYKCLVFPLSTLKYLTEMRHSCRDLQKHFKINRKALDLIKNPFIGEHFCGKSKLLMLHWRFL